MITKSILKKSIPHIIIIIFSLLVLVTVFCKIFRTNDNYNINNSVNNSTIEVVENMTPVTDILRGIKTQELQNLELYPRNTIEFDEIPIVEQPKTSTTAPQTGGMMDTDVKSKIYYNADISCGTNIMSVPGLTDEMIDKEKIKLCDNACNNNSKCKSWYITPDNKCWLKPCEEKDIHKYNIISECPGYTCTSAQEGDTCTSSVGWCCRKGTWEKGKCKTSIVGILSEDTNTAGIVQADTPGWQNNYGQSCTSYSKYNWCRNGKLTSSSGWPGGEKYNYPENNCVACGKGYKL